MNSVFLSLATVAGCMSTTSRSCARCREGSKLTCSTVGGTQKGDIVKELMKTCFDNGKSAALLLLPTAMLTAQVSTCST